MPTILTGVAADADFDLDITIPANGDAVSISEYWEAAIQQIADRGTYLYEKLGNFKAVGGELIYVDAADAATAKTRYLFIPACAFAHKESSGWSISQVHPDLSLIGTGNGNYATACLNNYLPHGAIITAVDWCYQAAGAGTMDFVIGTRSGIVGGASIGSFSSNESHSSFDTNLNLFAQAVSPTLTIDNGLLANKISLRVNDAQNNDLFHFAIVTWSDPGPRNF